jgi:hypothetical protein
VKIYQIYSKDKLQHFTVENVIDMEFSLTNVLFYRCVSILLDAIFHDKHHQRHLFAIRWNEHEPDVSYGQHALRPVHVARIHQQLS